MVYSRHPVHIGLFVLLLSVTGTANAQSKKPTAWLFNDKGKQRVFVDMGGGKWIGTHPTKSLIKLTELERTNNEIIIQNNASKLIIRLTQGRAYWRTPKSNDWKTWFKGTWGTVPPAILKSLSKPTVRNSPDDYVAKVGYFVPSDREPVANWEQKIQVIIYYVESMFRNDLRAKRMNTDGLKFETEDGKTRVHLIRSKNPASYYNNTPKFDGNKQYSLLSPEIAASLGPRDEVLSLVFAETYDPGPSDRVWKGVLARGGYYSSSGGLGIFSAHLLKDEFCATTIKQQPAKFFDKTPVPGRRALGHKMNSARCEFVEDGFGAVIHEMGHALGLPHDMRDQKRNIMSNGFRNIRKNLSKSTPRSQLVTFSDLNTNLLMSSRYLNPDLDLSDNLAPNVELEVVGQARNGLRIRITATDNTGLRAWAISDKAQDSVIAGGKLRQKKWNGQVVIPAKAEAGKYRLNLIVADNGGNQTRVRKELPANKK